MFKIFITFFIIILCAFGCGRSAPEVVLYTSVDEPYVRPIVDAFTRQTGIAVRVVTDTEATKSVGLAERLRAEQNNPRADVWWGNEPFHTVRLADEGLFAPYASPAADDIPNQYKDMQYRWTGVGLRVRVMAVASSVASNITGLNDLTLPVYKSKICMARPVVGTTAGHVTSIYIQLGTQKADQFFKALADNDIKLLGGNSEVVQQVAAGNFLIGLTDNDDVSAAQTTGGALSDDLIMVIPDQTQTGTLALPTTVALVHRKTISPDARRLIDWLLSASVEQQLIDARFAFTSVRAHNQLNKTIQIMPVDYTAIARQMPEAVIRATAILEGRK
jgi:iron(III) transport system substrate-binding protein